MQLFKKKTIIFGELSATQFILFEHKKLFSIIFFYFKGDGWQDRFHTHAFNAVSFKIFGQYMERTLVRWWPNDWTGYIHCETREKPRTEFIRYFPRDCYHKIGPSNGCMTMLISGPWKPTWKEWKDGKETVLSWGRKSI